MDIKSVKNIRKKSFSKIFNKDLKLNELLNNNDNRFKHLRNPVFQNIYQYLINYLLNISNEWFNNKNFTILDWGCGYGYVSYLLKNLNQNVLSCDIATYYNPIIESANINVTELKHEYKLPYNDCEFDVFLSFGVLEHTKNNLLSLYEINRVLKPNGLFFCFFLP